MWESFNLLAKLAGHMLLKHDSVGMEEAVKRKMFNLFKEKESFVQSCLEVWNSVHTHKADHKKATDLGADSFYKESQNVDAYSLTT